MTAPMAEPCRLCGGQTDEHFRLTVLGRHDVGYFLCRSCGSLQTEKPYWLQEAYTSALAVSDVGAVDRCLQARARVRLVLALCRGERRLLDFGGGSGLLVRLLRDIGVDAWMTDPNAAGELAAAHRLAPDSLQAGQFPQITAFEVLEHLSAPAGELSRLFALDPEVLMASTELWTPGRKADWWYLSPSSGQHIFFYSRKALQQIARTHGYRVVSAGSLHVFVRKDVRLRLSVGLRLWLRVLLSGKGVRLGRLLCESGLFPSLIAPDYQEVVSRRRRPEVSGSGNPPPGNSSDAADCGEGRR